MAKEMLINVSEGEECRIALLEDDKLEELYMERSSSTSHVGNIYKGRVTNVEASIQAAFVDFGLGRNGFLHISDLMPTYFGRGGEDIQEAVGRKMARRDRPPIQRCLRRGDEIVVQIIKEGIGTKGPTLSTYLSIPGRILVMMPGMGKFGVSRKIEDEDERRRLRAILDSLKPLKDVGFIIRTAGIGKSKTDIQRDLTYLTRLWQNIEKKMKSGPGPMELYTEGDLVTRTVRDVFSGDIDRVIVDNKEVARRVKEVIKLSNPRTKNKVDLYEEAVPLFHKYGIEREIELMYSRHVPLPSGGSLVIDSTEAIVAIDVNSGKFREHADAETTAFKTDMEAADEIPRQLRLRDLGGVIICDFIDLRYERHRRDLERRLHDHLKNDRAKTKVLRMSQFGIIEMTRQRMRPSLKRSIYSDCPHCKGSGLVKTPESMSLDVMRRLAIAVNDLKVVRVEMTVCPDVAFYLLNRKRTQLGELEREFKKRIIVRQDLKMGLDEMHLDLYDARDGMVYLDELGMSPSGQLPGEEVRGGRRPGGRGHGRRPDPRRPQSGASHAPHPPKRRDDRDDEPFDLDDEMEPRERGEDSRGPREPVAASAPQSSAPDEELDDSESEEQEDSSRVVEVDEPSEPMGEGPRAFEEEESGNGGRHRRRRRGRRGRGRHGGASRPAESGQRESRNAKPEESEESEDPPSHDDSEAAIENAADKDESAEQEDEVNGNVAEGAGAEGNAADGEGAPKRRRRRRGGRRHRRRRERAEAGANASGEPNAASDDSNESEPGSNSDGEESEPVGSRADESSTSQRRTTPQRNAPHRTGPTRTPPPRPSPAAALPSAPRTGSTDKHLVDDVPIDPEPPRRPRSHRDLDEIPEDFD